MLLIMMIDSHCYHQYSNTDDHYRGTDNNDHYHHCNYHNTDDDEDFSRCGESPHHAALHLYLLKAFAHILQSKSSSINNSEIKL